MKIKRNIFSLITIPVIALLLSGCPQSEEEISTKDPDPSDIMNVTFTYEDGSTHSRELPVNQMVLMFEEGVTPAEAKGVLNNMVNSMSGVGLTVVGQIPALGIYQLEIQNNATDPQDAIETLDSVIEALAGYERIDTVTYNELMEPYFVENDDDNSSFREEERCAFSVIDYYQAIPIFDEVISNVMLNPVTVAIIDSGLWLGSGQFDEIRPRIYNLDAPGVDPIDYHPYKHGTCVASIIAGDNGDGRTNGIALRVLGNNLSLMVGKATIFGEDVHMHWVLADARRAVEEGARIVNFSVGKHDEGRTPQWLIRLQNQFMRLFTDSASQNVLFVAAVSNDGFELNNNDCPAGLPADNLITVGGVESCNFEEKYSLSSTGPGIDIAAPATRIPACCLGDDLVGPISTTVEGNSFAAPIVTSIAAIILSIDPDLTGAQLKEFLTDEDHVWPAPEDVGGKRPALIKTVGSALLANTSSSAIDTIMDAFGGIIDDIPDPSGHMVNRLCGEIDFTVSGPGYSQSHHLNATDLAFSVAQTNFGIIGNHLTVFNMSQGSDTVQGFADSGFRLNQEYPIYDGGPNGVTVSAGAPAGDYIGTEGLSGSFMYTECELTTRSLPLDWFAPVSGPHQLVFIEAAGVLNPSTVNGFVESGGEIQRDVIYNVSGSFTMAFMLIYPDSDTLAHLEEVCEGGYEYNP